MRGPPALAILNRLKAGEPGKWGNSAQDEIRCLACHTTPALAGAVTRPEVESLLAEGVGCAACHGNPRDWVMDHSSFKPHIRERAYRERGMTRLYDMGERAATCLGCHVGAPADPTRCVPLRDMNHEMIAAGHPRLHFDFADHQRRLPPHWREKDRLADPPVERTPSFETKAWLTGRVAFAEATTRLLADRARRAISGDAEWPEWSDQRCFVCHRELPGDLARMPGRETVSTFNPGWPFNQPDDENRPGDVFQPAILKLRALRELFQRKEPDARLVIKPALEACEALERLRETVSTMRDEDVEALVRGLCQSTRPMPRDWEDACQMTHALTSLEWTRIRRLRRPKPGVNPLLVAARDALTLSRRENQDHFDSPRQFRLGDFQRNWKSLLDSILAEPPAEKPR